MANELEEVVSAISPGMTAEEMADIVDRVESYLDRAKALKAALDEKLFEYIEATGNEVVIGPVRYYVGRVRETVCRDRGECLASLLEQFGAGHVGEQFLARGAFRYGAIGREVDGETFARLFEVREREELKEGKAEKVRRLQKADERRWR